jgi:putative endonuclease
MWYIYILETRNGRLYTGATNDVDRRIKKHKNGTGARFTRIFGFKKLLYQEKHPTRSHALKREKEIKSWPRKKKLALMC